VRDGASAAAWSYHLGRISCLVDLVGAAAELTVPQDVVDVIHRGGGREVLSALREVGRVTVAELSERFGWDADVLLWNLRWMSDRGLLIVRIDGALRAVQATPRGEQALRDSESRT
jgi:hypothetical protein